VEGWEMWSLRWKVGGEEKEEGRVKNASRYENTIKKLEPRQR